MSTTESVKSLLNEHQFTKAYVLDDAFDRTPEFSQLGDLLGENLPDALAKLPAELASELNPILAEAGVEEDDWETAVGVDKFLAALWRLSKEGRLPADVGTAAFGAYNADVAGKKAALAPLLDFLRKDLGLTVAEAGRESKKLPADTKVVFLDLFLGITDDKSAREEAADKIKELLQGMGDRERPVVVLMSSKTGDELEAMAEDLRARAGLMGAKFRVVSKDEFKREDAIGSLLHDLLAPLTSANTLGDLIDTWDSALRDLRETIKGDLRALDLSDYAFLAKYRLEVEGMPLGAYLLEAYGDVLRYRLEGCADLRTASAKVDALQFDQMPPAHFLPQQGVNLLSHAVNFVNEEQIVAEGLTMPNAADKLQLGDVVVKASDLDGLTARPATLESIPVQVLISQVCDLQQGATDDLFLLEGRMARRSWTESIKAVDSRIDCFIWKGTEYSINWQQAKLKTWSKRLANNRLAPRSGTHRRLARLRPLPALNAQQLFASRLTRVGRLASPHGVVPVSLTIDYKSEKDGRVELFSTSAAEKAACLVNGAVLEGTPKKAKYASYLVFSRKFPRSLAAKLLDAAEKMSPAVRGDVADFAKSELALAPLRQPCLVGSAISHKSLKIDLTKQGGTPTSVVGITFSIPPEFVTKMAA